MIIYLDKLINPTQYCEKEVEKNSEIKNRKSKLINVKRVGLAAWFDKNQFESTIIL